MTKEQWDRVWVLCKTAFSMQPSDAAAFLEASNDDPEVIREATLALAARSNVPSQVIDEDTSQPWPQLGKQIGRFEVLEPIGRGGAGEVYKGRDTVLGRTVALKFIAQDVMYDRSVSRRFIREAQAASTLNHPNIVTVHEVVSADSVLAIAMEFVEGIPLRKLCGSPLPWEQVVAYGSQMSQALAAAHSHGIIHRDVKPENVMVRPDGYIKVLDFGLARNLSNLGPGNISSTLGLPVGTIRYMSPEQCRGEAATPASDVFALGVTLYELCAGQHPFQADSPLDVAHNIVRESPKPLAAKPPVPPALATLILQMLAKEPAARCTSADVVQRLAAVRESPPPRRQNRWYAAASAVALGAILATWMLSGKGASSESRLQLQNSAPLTSQQGYETWPAVSPDGTAIAFTWAERRGPPSQIWVRRLGESSAVTLATAVSGIVGSPTWSADGKRIFFKRSNPIGLGALMSIAATGGEETRLANLLVADPSSALDSSFDGRWLAYCDKPGPNLPHAVMILDLKTGERRQLTKPPEDHWGDWDPKFSPDGRAIAFKRVKGLWQDTLYLVPLSGGTPRQLTFDGQSIAGHTWLPGGKSLLASCQRGGTIRGLWRIQVEPAGQQPVLISESVFDLIAPASARNAGTIAWVNQISDENIYRVSTSGNSAPIRFITSTRLDTRPRWAPDGRIAFISDRAGSLEIWLAQKDGSSQTQVSEFRRGSINALDWSPDGRHLVATAYSDERVVTLKCEPLRLLCEKPELVPRTLASESEPSWASDGSLYFWRTEGIWKEPASGGQPVSITRDGGQRPQESRDGRWLYYHKSLSGIWRTRLPVPDSGADEEEKVIHLPSEYVPVWALGTTEIFFFQARRASEPAGIFGYNIATRKIRRITSASYEIFSITVSPDQKELLYSQLDYTGSNVFVANTRAKPTQ
jgi:serine/threonine protein kinase